MAEQIKEGPSYRELEARLEDLTEVATDTLVAIWRAVQAGRIDERGTIADAGLRLRDALNPKWPADSSWLPDELRESTSSSSDNQ